MLIRGLAGAWRNEGLYDDQWLVCGGWTGMLTILEGRKCVANDSVKTRSPYVRGEVARTPFLGHSVSNFPKYEAEIVS